MHSVSIKDLTLNFGALSVLKDLSLDVAEGEFIVLLGPSGCGKSTLLNCIAGLLDISDGQIWIKGKNVTWAEPSARSIGMVFQSYALYPQMTVRGNLTFGLKNARMPKPEIEKRVARAAEILQIGPLLDRKPAALSGGSGKGWRLAGLWCGMSTCSCLTNRCRTLMPNCALIWPLNDTWPVSSWSSLDHGGGWKLLHHMASQFFQPILVSAIPVTGGIDLRAVNDTAGAADLTDEALAVDMAGKTRLLADAAIAVPADAAIMAMHIAAADIGPDEMLAYGWRDAKGTPISGDVFAPWPYKTYNLLPPKLTHSVVQAGDVWQIGITAQALAFFVSLEADQPGRFSMNAFTLFPGHPATVIFTSADPDATPTITLRDLHSATYGPA